MNFGDMIDAKFPAARKPLCLVQVKKQSRIFLKTLMRRKKFLKNVIKVRTRKSHMANYSRMS